MEREEHKECYGTMFPDALHYRANQRISGKVFAYELNSSGGMYASRSDRKFSAEMKQWDDCRKCHEFDHCYKFCMAQLAIEGVIVSE